MALSQTSVLKLYNTVIDDVIASVRDAFLDDGVDEQVLQEMKQVWTGKLMASKAVETNPDPSENSGIMSNSAKSASQSKANGAKSKASRNAAARAASAAQAETNANAQENIVNGTATKTNNPITTASATTNGTTSTTTTTQPPQQAQNQQPASLVANLDPNKLVAIQITLPPQTGGTNSEPRVLTIQVPASALQEHQLQQVLTGPVITSIMPLPPHIASSVLQQHVNSFLQNQSLNNSMQIQNQLDGASDPMETCIDDRILFMRLKRQLDGTVDTSDEGSDISDDIGDGDDDDDDINNDEEDDDGDGGAEEEPLNSEDDVTDEDPTDLFETDNVVVCQYDKITRSRNKWKFYLKDGIMNIGGKDYVFQKSNGDAEW